MFLGYTGRTFVCHAAKQGRFLDYVVSYGRGLASPSFSAAVTSFYEARFGLYRNSGNRQERMMLSSVRHKHLM